MKKVKNTLLLTVFMNMVFIHAGAYDFEVDGLYYNIVSISDLTCEVTTKDSEQSSTYSGDITVPASVQYNGRTLKVVGIGDDAFSSKVTSVSLPEGIEYIGRYAFAWSPITRIQIPTSLKHVKENAFLQTKQLTRVDINSLKAWCDIVFDGPASFPFAIFGERNEGSSITYGLSTTEGELYLNGTLCTAIIIPKIVTRINNYTFAGVKSIKAIMITEGVEEIGDFAFANCVNLKSIETPSTCKTIGKHAFNGCSRLEKVKFSEGLESIGERSFSYCTSLSSIEFPSTINEIDGYMFYGTDLRHLKIHNSNESLFLPKGSLCNIKSIDFQRDFWCSYWHKTEGSGTLGYILNSPFQGSSKLKSVIIGAAVGTIPKTLFAECSFDSVVIQKAVNPIQLEYSDNAGFPDYYNLYRSLFYKIPIRYLYVDRPMEALVNGSVFHPGDFVNRYPLRSGTVGDFFDSSTSFEEIVIGNHLEDISFLKFGQYANLRQITFGKGITSIPDLTKNENLEDIVIVNDTPPNAVGFANTTYLHAHLYVPKGCTEKYTNADVWKNFWNIMELEQDFESLGVEDKRSEHEQKVISRYTINGTKTTSSTKSVNIIIMSDGTAKKQYVK